MKNFTYGDEQLNSEYFLTIDDPLLIQSSIELVTFDYTFWGIGLPYNIYSVFIAMLQKANF